MCGGNKALLPSPTALTKALLCFDLIYTFVFLGNFIFERIPLFNFLFQKKCRKRSAGGWSVQDEYSSCQRGMTVTGKDEKSSYPHLDAFISRNVCSL